MSSRYHLFIAVEVQPFQEKDAINILNHKNSKFLTNRIPKHLQGVILNIGKVDSVVERRRKM